MQTLILKGEIERRLFQRQTYWQELGIAGVMLNGVSNTKVPAGGILHLQPALPIGLKSLYSVHASKIRVFQTRLRSLEHFSGTTNTSQIQFPTQPDAFDPVFL